MHILFDEAGKLLTGRLLSEAESSLQVELDSGKRVKVKAVNALLRFEKPAPGALMASATELSTGMDLALAYEFAPEDEFGFADLAREYFSSSASTAEQVAALLCLQGAPHYFRRAGKGRYKKAPADILAQALAGIEKKKQQQAQIEAWAAERAPAALQDPLQARQERARVQGRGRGRAQQPHRAAHPAAERRCHPQRLPVPLAALPVRPVPQGHRLPRAAGPGDHRRAATGHRAGVFHRRLAHHRDRRRAFAARPGQRLGGAGHPHRRTGSGCSARERHRPGGAPPPVHRLHAGPQDHHAARRGRAGLHADGRARLPCGVALRHVR